MNNNYKHFLKKLLATIVYLTLGASYLLFPNSTLAGPVFAGAFTCEAKLYQSIGRDLMLLDPATGAYNQVGASDPVKYNAIGWDRRSNFIYGYRKVNTNRRLFRLGTSGLTADLGRPTEAGTGDLLQARAQSADMDENGNLWLHDRFVPRSLFKVNVDTVTYTRVDFGGIEPESPNDIVYIASANSFWGVEKSTNNLIRFNIANHMITSFAVTDLPTGSSEGGTGYGAAWTNADDELFVARNTGGIYRIDNYLTNSPIATKVLDSIATSSNDGASCPTAGPIFPKSSAGNGTLRYADSGVGQYKDRILFMDWKDSSLEDGVQEGDIVEFAVPASSCMANGTLTATFTNIDDPGGIAINTKPRDMLSWGGASFHQLYNTAGSGEAIYAPVISPSHISNHIGFTIDWNLVIDGQTRSPDIFLIDAESTTEDAERIDATTNGGVWSVIENALNDIYVVDGIGTTQVQIKNTEDPNVVDAAPDNTKGFSPLLLSKGATRTEVTIRTLNSNGNQAVAFALLAPCDHGDAPASYGDAAHAFIEEPISPLRSQLGLRFSAGTPYLGATYPDSESSAQTDPSPAQGDDNNNDAFDATRNDDEDIDVPQLPAGRTVSLSIPVNGNGYLYAWFDWNADGDFADANERVANNISVSSGNTTLDINVPNDATLGQSFARFRISSEEDLTSSGYAEDGEVEDVAIEIVESTVCRVDDLEDNLYSTSSVSANSRLLNELTRTYQAKFNRDNWEGQVLAFNLETANNDGSVKSQQWDAAVELARTGRKLFTYNPTLVSGKIFQWSHLNNSQKTILRDGGTLQEGKNVLRWVKGLSENEGSLLRTRTTILGDIINSNLLFKDTYANYGYSNLPEGGTYASFLGDKQNSTAAIFVGANDGMLHAFNASTGGELFAYIPNEIFPKLVTISDKKYGCTGAGCLSHEYLVDGKSSIGDTYFASTSDWHTVLVGGLGKGGKGLFALDVSNAESFAASDVLWEISSTQATSAGADADEFVDHLGETIPAASIVRTNNSDSNKRWAAIVANGYGASNHQAVLFIIDVETGALIKAINTGSGTEEQPNGLSSPIAIDSNNDSIIDRVYAGDLLGNLWAFDVSSNNPDNWDVDFSGTPLFNASKPITAAPQVGRNPKGGLMVYFGTGKYIDISDNFYDGSPTANTYYGIHDKGSPVALSALIEQTILQEAAANGTGLNARVTSTNHVNFTTHKGWFMELPTAGERVISQALLRHGRLIFTTMTPPGNVCEWGGTSWLMEFSAVEGKRLDVVPIDINDDKEFNESDKVLYQGDRTILSGVQDTDLGVVFSTPVVVSHGRESEGKYLTGTGGSIGMFRESTTNFKGRVSWRQVR